MGNKVAVVTDSTAYIPKSIRDELSIHMVPLSVIFEDGSFEEEVSISTEAFYDKMAEASTLPTTSQPPIGRFITLFSSLADQGYTQIISIHLSANISGTYEGAMSAGMMIDEIEVHGFDSELSCAPQGSYVIEAAKMALAGKNANEIVARLQQMKETMRAYFMVADLKHLYRGGRLGGGELVVGQMLKIKPILHFVEGRIVPFEKVRTKRRALGRILQLLDEDVSSGGTYHVTVIHAIIEKEAKELAQKIRAEYGEQVTVEISYFGPVIGTHLGAGSLGVAWYKCK